MCALVTGVQTCALPICGLQHLLRRLVERSCAAFVRQDDLAPRMAGVEGGAALNGELVERQVVAGAVERPAELFAPGRRRLPGPGVDRSGERRIGEEWGRR